MFVFTMPEHIQFIIVTIFAKITFQITTFMLKLAKNSNYMILSGDNKKTRAQ